MALAPFTNRLYHVKESTPSGVLKMGQLELILALLPATDDDLTHLVCEISEREFGKPFYHRCRFNYRLRTTGGRYLLGTHNLEFNPRYAETHGLAELIRTIRHELCHYHLHLAGRGYRHRDLEFMQLLKRVDGSRWAKPPATSTRAPLRYEYVCKSCRQVYLRRRKMDVSRFVCGNCHGKLSFVKEHPFETKG